LGKGKKKVSARDEALTRAALGKGSKCFAPRRVEKRGGFAPFSKIGTTKSTLSGKFQLLRDVGEWRSGRKPKSEGERVGTTKERNLWRGFLQRRVWNIPVRAGTASKKSSPKE